MPEAPAPGTPMLNVQRLNAWYGESHVLHGVDFTVGEGEVVTLLGRNGAGKTTTMKSIMGLVPRRAGSIAYKGRETVRMRPNQVARAGIAICPEERGIFASLSVTENLMLPPAIAPGGLDLPTIYTLFPNLKERAASQGTKLSGGEQQMLAIGRILRTGARFLLLDEPTEGPGPGHRAADRPHHPRASHPRLHRVAGGTEFPLRRHRRRPSLRDGAWPCDRHDPEQRD